MSAPVRYDDAMIRTVESMWLDGELLRTIAATVGRSMTWVSDAARKQGLPPRGRGWGSTRLSRERAAAYQAASTLPVFTVRCPDCLARYETDSPNTAAHAGCTRNARLIAASEAASFAVADPNIYPDITE